MSEGEKQGSVELGFVGTGTSLTKSAGLAVGGGTLIAVLMEIGVYPDTITLAGKTINMQGPLVMGYVGAGAAWFINVVRKFIMKHGG